MKVLSQEFIVLDKLHAQGLLDFLAAYFMGIQEDILDLNYGIQAVEGEGYELILQLDVKDEAIQLVLEVLAELIDQMPPEFINFVQVGEYRIIHGSTALENHLLSELQLQGTMLYEVQYDVSRLKYDMEHYKKIHQSILDEVRSLRVYNTESMTPRSLQQILEAICEDIEREDILEEYMAVPIH